MREDSLSIEGRRTTNWLTPIATATGLLRAEREAQMPQLQNKNSTSIGRYAEITVPLAGYAAETGANVLSFGCSRRGRAEYVLYLHRLLERCVLDRHCFLIGQPGP